MSTIAPSSVRKHRGADGPSAGVTMLDAPVSGGEVGAIAGSLTIMVGGVEAAFECARPVFACLGTTIARASGESGAGQGGREGLQPDSDRSRRCDGRRSDALRALIGASIRPRSAKRCWGGFASSRILENHGQRMLDRNFKAGFKSWMHQKDLPHRA